MPVPYARQYLWGVLQRAVAAGFRIAAYTPRWMSDAFCLKTHALRLSPTPPKPWSVDRPFIGSRRGHGAIPPSQRRIRRVRRDVPSPLARTCRVYTVGASPHGRRSITAGAAGVTTGRGCVSAACCRRLVVSGAMRRPACLHPVARCRRTGASLRNTSAVCCRWLSLRAAGGAISGAGFCGGR
jgi:hypothetical protein